MNKRERMDRMLNAIVNENIITTKEFIDYAESIGIKYLTATRDLKELRDNGKISIDFGRIVMNGNKIDQYSREYRRVQNISEKKVIALKANECLEPTGETIYVSPGTTCEWFVKTIDRQIDLVVTNGLEVFQKCVANKNILDVVLIGGRYRKNSHAFVGSDALETLTNYRFSKVFLTATNVRNNNYLYTSNENESLIFVNSLKQTKESYVLLDSSKFEEDNGIRKATKISDLDFLITDNLIKDETLNQLESDVKILIANIE
jgi:DeoR family lactose phosphotransferase system repressor